MLAALLTAVSLLGDDPELVRVVQLKTAKPASENPLADEDGGE